jgi:DnaJ-class molecular chaperone
MNPHLEKYMATYAPERCARCNGSGKLIPADYADLVFSEAAEIIVQQINPADSIYDCPVCGGRGCVLVVQPSRKCAHCGGTGAGVQPRCQFCGGRGWMLVWKEGGKG